MPGPATERRGVREAVADERGFTLIELLWAMVLSVIVLGGAITFLIVTVNQQNDITSRTLVNNQAEQGLEALVRDLREATTTMTLTNTPSTVCTQGATPVACTQLSFDIPTPGSPATPEPVVWTCPSTTNASTFYLGRCQRSVTTGGATSTRAVILGVQSMAFNPVSSTGAALSYPVTPSSTPTVVSMSLTLNAQVTNYAVSSQQSPNGVIKGSAGNPVTLYATADMRNF